MCTTTTLSPGMSTITVRLCQSVSRTVPLRAPPVRPSPSSTRHVPRRCFSLHSAPANASTVSILGQTYPADATTNISPAILAKLGRNLLFAKNHPLSILKQRIELFFNGAQHLRRLDPLAAKSYAILDKLPPVVTVHQNFDSLLVPKDHVSRSPNDTYYVNAGNVLRCHTSAHQVDAMKQGLGAILISGDVYRRDEIDASHYPAFHQMEGIRLFSQADLAAANPACTAMFESSSSPSDASSSRLARQPVHNAAAVAVVEKDLKFVLECLARHLFGQDTKIRWVDAFFPFTHPSWEMEVFFQGKWMEILGCGVIQQRIITAAGIEDKIGWAFGMGLERLAMVLFDIPDIRLFWSTDARFVSQFDEAAALSQPGDMSSVIKFKPFSKFPPCYKDITFWITPSFSDNNFYELLRSLAGDLVEDVVLIDKFDHPKTKKTSKCFRVNYRSLERSLTNEEVNLIQSTVRKEVVAQFGVELR